MRSMKLKAIALASVLFLAGCQNSDSSAETDEDDLRTVEKTIPPHEYNAVYLPFALKKLTYLCSKLL